MTDEAVGIAKADGADDEVQPIHHPARALISGMEAEGEHARAGGHLPTRYRLTWMGIEKRVAHPSDHWMRFQRPGDGKSRGAMAFHAQRERLVAAQNQLR